MTGRVIVFGVVGLLVVGFLLTFGRTNGGGRVRTRFKEWSPQK